MPRPRPSPKKSSSPGVPLRAPRKEKMMSGNEKRQLILAHAANRRTLDPVQRLSLWAGVILCTLFIAVAWFYTVGSSLKKTMAARPLQGEVQDIAKAAKDFQARALVGTSSDVDSIGRQLEEMRRRLSVPRPESVVLDEMVRSLSASSTASTTLPLPLEGRADVFRPDPSTSSTSRAPSSTVSAP